MGVKTPLGTNTDVSNYIPINYTIPTILLHVIINVPKILRYYQLMFYIRLFSLTNQYIKRNKNIDFKSSNIRLNSTHDLFNDILFTIFRIDINIDSIFFIVSSSIILLGHTYDQVGNNFFIPM